MGIKPIVCDICGKTYILSRSAPAYRVSGGRIACQDCYSAMTNKIEHTFECEVCGSVSGLSDVHAFIDSSGFHIKCTDCYNGQGINEFKKSIKEFVKRISDARQ